MSIQILSALENAIEPYLSAGYIITTQSDASITLRAPARRFSWMLFLLSLLILWPVAIIYLIWFNQRRERTICARVTSQGNIEIIGFTLSLLKRERQRQRALTLLYFLLLALMIVVALAILKFGR